MGKHDDEFIVILNLPRVFSQDEMEGLVDTVQFANAADLDDRTGDDEPDQSRV